MKAHMAVVSALAGSLLFAPVALGQANAAFPHWKDAVNTSHSGVTLVGRGGGGGRGLSISRGGGRAFSGGGRSFSSRSSSGGSRSISSRSLSGGDRAFSSRSVSGGDRAFSTRSLSGGNRAFGSRAYGGSSNFKAGRMARADITGSRTFSKRSFDGGSSLKSRNRFVGNNWRGDNRKGGKKFDRDRHDKFAHLKPRRVFRNGAWVWVYGPGYYTYSDECWWLRRQAIITGSPYWWRRYNLCIGGYNYY